MKKQTSSAGLAAGLQTRAAQAVMGFCGARRHAGAPPGLRRGRGARRMSRAGLGAHSRPRGMVLRDKKGFVKWKTGAFAPARSAVAPADTRARRSMNCVEIYARAGDGLAIRRRRNSLRQAADLRPRGEGAPDSRRRIYAPPAKRPACKAAYQRSAEACVEMPRGCKALRAKFADCAL